MINTSEDNYKLLFKKKERMFSEAFKHISSKQYFQSPAHSYRYRTEFSLIEKEGLSLGTSSGINVAGAIQLAKELGPNHTIVTILCDTSEKYRSKIFNKKFLKEKGLSAPSWL